MPTVIDAFVLELGLDSSRFTRGQREAMDQMRRFQEAALGAGNQVESQGKRVFDLLSNFRREALTALGVFFGGRGAMEFLSFVTSLDASAGRLSRTLDMNVREVSAWQSAFEQMGGSAEGANAALSGLSSEMNRFQLTGQSAMLPVLSRLGISLYDQNRNLKTSGQLWLELADAVQGMDPRQAAEFLRMIPGANQDMINFALLGRRAMEQFLQAGRDTTGTTRESAVAAMEYQRQLALLERSSTALGRSLVTYLAPALTTVMDKMRALLQAMGSGSIIGAGERTLGPSRSLGNALGFGIVKAIVGPMAAEEMFGPTPTGVGEGGMASARAELTAKMLAAFGGGRGGAAATSEIKDYIRAAAAARGIDPEIALRVFGSESGFNPAAVGDRGTSFGLGQLHYGGGLGDAFTKKTGLSASDPSTWRAQIDFALDQARSGGWTPFHGWKGAPFAGIGGPGGQRGGGSTTVNIGNVNVNAPRAEDAEGVAREIAPALKRSLSAGAANYGQQ